MAVLVCLLSGMSLNKCADTVGCILRPLFAHDPALVAVARARHALFSFRLLDREPEWGRAVHWTDFWRRALAQQRCAS